MSKVAFTVDTFVLLSKFMGATSKETCAFNQNATRQKNEEYFTTFIDYTSFLTCICCNIDCSALTLIEHQRLKPASQ